jgi:hypothetical protein
MKLGTKVRKIVPDIDGTVTGARWDEQAGTLSVKVACTIDGQPHERWFAAAELVVIDPAAADQPPPAQEG